MRSASRVLTLVLSGILCSTGLHSQVDRSAPFTITSNDVRSRIESTNAQVRKELASKLALFHPITGTLCDQIDSMEVMRIGVNGPKDSELLILESKVCEALFLVPLEREATNWVYTGTVPLWAKFSRPQIALKSLIIPGIDEIVVTNVTVDEGTGVLQKNFSIFKIIGGRVRTVLDQPQSVHLQIPSKERISPGTFSEEQNSEFTFEAPDDDSQVMSTLREKAEYMVQGHRIVLFRRYVWDKGLQMYRAIADTPE